jgi:hypothetical protein
MIAPQTLQAFSKRRTCSDKGVLCHAPFTNVHFHQSGNGVACCCNAAHVLGTYPQHSIYFSSSICHNRGKLPSMTSPYDAGFVEQLEEFISLEAVGRFFASDTGDQPS